jgi:hypothetical protein
MEKFLLILKKLKPLETLSKTEQENVKLFLEHLIKLYESRKSSSPRSCEQLMLKMKKFGYIFASESSCDLILTILEKNTNLSEFNRFTYQHIRNKHQKVQVNF